ncbi:MAG: type II secretion system protein [Proteobacteria bacterium]|nr:type II secretion system protein [Pseudomonadota bacterium]
MKERTDCTQIDKLKGFSLPEVIVVLGAVAIISTISYGDVTRMFDKQREEANKLDMLEIRKALELYAIREGELPQTTTQCEDNLPVDSDIWSAQLAKYSNLSSNRICFDQNGLRRTYQADDNDIIFASGDYGYSEFYATVTNASFNKIDDSGTWSTPSEFNNFSAKQDDIVVKYTDKEHKIDLYKETLKRIETIESYLERYARAKRSLALAYDVDDFDEKIFYPSDGQSGGDYYVVQDSTFESSTSSMKATDLAKLLGLPEVMGKEAVTGRPMFYISNPGPSRAAPCTGERSTAPYYPPVVLPTTDGELPAGC